MVQRVLSAKDENHGRWGALFAGLLKLIPLYIMVLPGTMARVLYPNLARADLVFPTLMFDLLPTGILGIVLAGFLAALMSQIDSTLNSASTLVTMDFVRKRKPDWDSEKLMWSGRLFTAVFMILAAAWAPFIENFSSLFKYLQKVLSYTVPPIAALFIVGLFWKRANARGALLAVVTGLVVGVGLFIGIELLGVFHWHFLYVAFFLFVLAAMVAIAGSFLAPPPPTEKIAGLTWNLRFFREESQQLNAMPWYKNYRWQSLGLLLVTAALVWTWR